MVLTIKLSFKNKKIPKSLEAYFISISKIDYKIIDKKINNHLIKKLNFGSVNEEK